MGDVNDQPYKGSDLSLKMGGGRKELTQPPNNH